MTQEKLSVSDVLPRFEAYLRKNPSWGSLHIVLEDGNLKDTNVEFCITHADRIGDREGAELGRILLAMSKTQRGKLSLID